MRAHSTSDDVPHAVGVVTIDVAFISLRLHPAVAAAVSRGGRRRRGAGETAVRGRTRRSRETRTGHGSRVHEAVLARVTEAAGAAGFRRVGMTPSPITGATGNQEFFLHLRSNVVVLGAGAIGSVYAAKLSAHHPVTVIGRPDHVAAIARDGLRVIGRESFTARVRAAVDLGRAAE